MSYRALYFLLVVVAGCSNGHYKPIISDSVRLSLKPVKVVSIVKNNGIDIQIIPSTKARDAAFKVGLWQGGIVGGLAGSLIGIVADAGITVIKAKNAEKTLRPYQTRLKRFNVDEKLHRSLKDNLAKMGVEISDYVVADNFRTVDLYDYIDDLDDEKLLAITTSYSFDPTKNMIHIVSEATLYLKKLKNNKGYRTLDWSVFYQTPRRSVKYFPKSLAVIEAEVSQLKIKYEPKISKVRNEKKQAIRRERDNKIKTLFRYQYGEYENSVERTWWGEGVLEDELDKGFHRVAVGLADTFSVESEDVMTSWRMIPVADSVSPPKATVQGSLISENTESNYRTYVTKKHIKYIFPTDETLQTVSNLASKYTSNAKDNKNTDLVLRETKKNEP